MSKNILKKRFITWISKKQALLSFLISSLFLILFYLFFVEEKQFYHDAKGYFQYTKSFWNGSFSLYNYSINSIRGYFYPLLLFVPYSAAKVLNIDASMTISMFCAVFSSFIFTIILPKLFIYKETAINIIGRILPLALFLIYWEDLIYVPLSDFWSAGFIFIAILILYKFNIEAKDKYLKNSLLSLLAGTLLYATYNTRTIYLFVIPVIIALFFIYNVKKSSRNLIKYSALILCGLLICSIPQMIINKHSNDIVSPLVITSNTKYSEGLFNFQLETGIEVQRYETIIVNLESGHPKGGVKFYDDSGLYIKQLENIDKIRSIEEYISLVVKYPLDFLGIYGRHLINVFHIPYRNTYLTSLYHYNGLIAVSNYTVCFIACTGVAFVNKRKKKNIDKQEIRQIKYEAYNPWYKNTKLVYLLSCLVPCAMILPGAIELRFFVMLYILIYEFIAFYLLSLDFLHYIRMNWFKLLIIYFVLLSIMCAVWGNTFVSEAYGPILLS